jgi:phosphoribosylglycinamide formyltransferase/phosphoribosylglycinamide formyltransferase-1
MTRSRIAVLASGGGSNLQALIDHFRTLGERRAGDIVLVASDRADAGALGRAARAGISTATLPSRRQPDAMPMDELFAQHDIDLVVLAGYMQYVPHDVTRRFTGRILNVHPALLPAFGGAGMYGARVHRAVLAAGATTSGPTVHFVDDEYDHGTVIAQWPVPVRLDDDEHTLAARVLRAEHILYPRVIQAVAAGQVRLGPDGHIEHPFVLDVTSLPPLDEDLGHDTR